MKTILKTIVTLVITATVPMVEFFILGCLVGIVLLFVSISSGTVKPDGGIFTSIFWWAFMSIIISLPIAFGHVFLLGLPAILLGWYFRVIHWSSTLIVSSIIGAMPTAVFIFISEIGWSNSLFLWKNDFGALTVGLGIMLSVATIMGLFGFSGGVAFWLLWRYWVFPNSPAGRPLPLLPSNL